MARTVTARPEDYPDQSRFIGVVTKFLLFAMLEKLARSLARRLNGKPAASPRTANAAGKPSRNDPNS